MSETVKGIPIETRIRLKKLSLAKQFLEKEVAPRVVNGENLDYASFSLLMTEFQRKQIGIGTDFDLAHVWIVANNAVTLTREEHGFGSYEASLAEGTKKVLSRLSGEELDMIDNEEAEFRFIEKYYENC